MNTKKVKKSTLTTLITIAGIVAVYFVMTMLNNSGAISSSISGLFVTICSYAILAVSLNLVVGLLGELSLGHAGFMYIGAFTGAIFTQLTEDSIQSDILRLVMGIVIGVIFAAIFGLIIGSAVLRLQGDYLAIVTLAFGEIIKNVLGAIYIGVDSNGFHFSLKSTTELIEKGVASSSIVVKGPQGISGVDRMSTFGIGIVLLIVTVLVVMNLSDSRSGRAIKAVRDNKIAAETVGINISKYRLLAFTISAALAGMAGVLYSHGLGTVQSSKYDFNTSIDILVMVVLGGMGNIPGSIIAAIVLTILPQTILRPLGDYRMLIYAIVLIVMMIFTWNNKCIDLRKSVQAKVKGLFPKKNKEVQ